MFHQLQDLFNQGYWFQSRSRRA